MVIKEAQRAYTFFNLFGFSVDLIIVNRMIPDQVEDPYFLQWKAIQEQYYRTIEEIFAPLPLLSLPLFSREIVGLPLLEEIARTVYGDQDPTQLFFSQKPVQIEKVDGRYILSLNLPFVEKSDLDLTQKGEELIVRAGAFKRNILLPRILLHHSILGAKFEGERLHITFAP